MSDEIPDHELKSGATAGNDGPRNISGSTPDLAVDLKVPAAWDSIPTDAQGYRTWVKGQVATLDLSPSDAAAVEANLGAAMAEARAQGLIMAAGFVSTVAAQSSEGDHSQGQEVSEPGASPMDLIAATLFINFQRLDLNAPALSPTTLLMAIAESEADHGISLLADPDVLVLSDHNALRVVSVQEFPEDKYGPYAANTMLNYHLILGDRKSILTIGFVTPCYWLIDSLVQLFDQIASTVRLQISEGSLLAG